MTFRLQEKNIWYGGNEWIRFLAALQFAAVGCTQIICRKRIKEVENAIFLEGANCKEQ